MPTSLEEVCSNCLQAHRSQMLSNVLFIVKIHIYILTKYIVSRKVKYQLHFGLIPHTPIETELPVFTLESKAFKSWYIGGHLSPNDLSNIFVTVQLNKEKEVVLGKLYVSNQKC